MNIKNIYEKVSSDFNPRLELVIEGLKRATTIEEVDRALRNKYLMDYEIMYCLTVAMLENKKLVNDIVGMKQFD